MIPRLLLRRHDAARIVEQLILDLPASDSASPLVVPFADATWELAAIATPPAPLSDDKAPRRLSLRATLRSGRASACSLGWELALPAWSPAHHLVLPGVVYAGNRFPSGRYDYPPRLRADESRPDASPRVTDIPRLSAEPGPSRIQLKSGALAFPAAAAFDPASRTAWIVEFPAFAGPHETGLDFEESPARDSARLRLAAPGVREQRYTMMNTAAPSPDRGVEFHTGQHLSLDLAVHHFPCPDIQTLHDRLFAIRARHANEPASTPAFSPAASAAPLSACFDLIEAHYHRDFWWPEAGLFRTDGGREHCTNPYQTGWCGGLIAEYALLAASDDPLTRERCHTHLDRALGPGVSPSGLLYGKFNDGWRADCWYEALDGPHAHRRGYTLIRRQGDALLYLVRTLALLRARGAEPPAAWLASTRRLAATLAALWRREGQFGQWVDQDTAAVRVGGSACGAIIPGALAEAYQFFGDAAFLAAATDSAEFFHERVTRAGLATGGPGDALQCPDSESAYALVESYVSLHEATADPRWLARAAEAARQFASWVIAHDYPFPPDTEFHRLGIRSRGAVIANAQNGHGSPGICTHSGLGLFKLFRATGDTRHLDLLQSIARALPQFVSRPDRPVHAKDGRALPSGWMNERCSLTDWDNNLGGVFYGPCWPEVSLLLTTAELPGVYARPDLGRVWCLDHVEASLTADGTLALHNPTAFPARVRIFTEHAHTASRPLPRPLPNQFPLITLPAGSSRRVPLAPNAT